MSKIEISLPDYFNSLPEDIRSLKEKIQNIEKNLQPKEPSVYLSRNEVAEMLSVDLSTIHNWTKKGILTAFQIGGRIFYKRSNIEAAIQKLEK
ncbi:helix-turn-helix domain-containing protein [Gaetbulibacter jejuensis]|uniref:Helix-turn-helix domain-containing protein n=1 Tax=Gaetbulibacter jejuensis TaxID=584607 RepID=A0ABP3UMH2_9FLAO